MPIYEYDCENCGQLVTIRKRISEADPTTCPLCGGKHLVRRISHVYIAKDLSQRMQDPSWIDKLATQRPKKKT